MITKPGQFSTYFTVAPYKAHYWFVVSCPGYETQKVAIRFGEDATPMKPMNVGELIMKRMK